MTQAELAGVATRQTIIAMSRDATASLEMAFRIARVRVPLDEVFRYPENEEKRRTKS
jgi:DNA-binding XRE family transcriptional regulator